MKRRDASAGSKERMFRSSPPGVFLRKAVLKRCSKFAGELPCRIVIEIALAEFLFIRTPMEGCFKIFKNLPQNSQKTYQYHFWISFNTVDNLHSWKTQYVTAQQKKIRRVGLYYFSFSIKKTFVIWHLLEIKKQTIRCIDYEENDFLDPSSSFPIEENRESRTPNTVMGGSGPKNKK